MDRMVGQARSAPISGGHRFVARLFPDPDQAACRAARYSELKPAAVAEATAQRWDSRPPVGIPGRGSLDAV